jgi:molybdenum cofactor synthesis domain-containing protein
MRAAIITISSSRSRASEDEGGPALAEFARSLGAQIAAMDILPDDRARIEQSLRHFADTEGCELVLTTGGTGLSPSDVTPEATKAVLDRDAPGIAEAMRLASREHTPHWMLSRGVAGVRRGTLIVNFPGSPRSIREIGEAIALALPHAVAVIRETPASQDHAHQDAR